MAEHTPGPWEVRGRWYIGKADDPSSLAEVKSCYTVPASNEAEHEANARLIAAAPDLLETAEHLLSLLGARFRPEDIAVVRARKGLRAAIAKAKGDAS